jgi:L-arabinose isomerase
MNADERQEIYRGTAMTAETGTAKIREKQIQSFEVAEGDTFGDLLSADRIHAAKGLKIGLFASGFFEYWRMYPDLRAQVEHDAGIVHRRLSEGREVVTSPVVDTMDAADEAGHRFREAGVDVLVMAYRTYIPDAYVHQLLSHLPGVPALMFASQSRASFDYNDDYSGVLRNSGLMALVQLCCGLKRMGQHKHAIECIAGSIRDDATYQRIDRYLRVVTIARRLKTMTFGVIGQVFRGMFDFEYDKTKVRSALGPEVINLQVDHLVSAFEQAQPDDPEVQAMLTHVLAEYDASALGPSDIERAARAAVALKRMVRRFRLDGLALLGQHLVERKLKTTPYLGLAELYREGFPCVTEGDVIGLIMMKILHHLSGNMPFFVEWSEFDIERNAWMLLGHGFGDPTQARTKPPVLVPAAEQWGLEGAGCSLGFIPSPGPCTMAHFVEKPDGWHMVLSGGEFLDLEPLPINEVHAVVKVKRPILEYAEELVKAGVPHHIITVRGDVRKELEQLANLLEITVIRL